MEWTKRSQRRRGFRGLEEISPRTYTHLCMVHGLRQQCGEACGGQGPRLGGVELRGEMGHISGQQ